MKKERIVSLDVIRALAIFLVTVLHGISLGGALGINMLSASWTVTLYIKQFACACVPLFIILTGFLQNRKALSAKYYFGIVPLYISYFIISVITLISRSAADSSFNISFFSGVYKILNFTANDYAWYFEMYIGLFLLIPFLNLCYHGLKKRSDKLVLIATLIFLTVFPELCKSFAPYYKNGGVALDIIPDFFTSLYPITYYFIGAYISEFRPCPKRLLRLAALFGAPMFPTALIYIFTRTRGNYAWYMMNGNAAPTVLITAVSIFIFFYDIDFKNRALSKVSKFVSDSTFEAYLFSFIFDSYVYGISNIPSRLENFFSQLAGGNISVFSKVLPILFVFVASVACSFMLRALIIKPVTFLISKLAFGKTV